MSFQDGLSTFLNRTRKPNEHDFARKERAAISSSALPHMPDHSDIDPTLLKIINKSLTRKYLLVPTSIKTRRRHSLLDHFLPSPKPLEIPVLELFEALSEKVS